MPILPFRYSLVRCRDGCDFNHARQQGRCLYWVLFNPTLTATKFMGVNDPTISRVENITFAQIDNNGQRKYDCLKLYNIIPRRSKDAPCLKSLSKNKRYSGLFGFPGWQYWELLELKWATTVVLAWGAKDNVVSWAFARALRIFTLATVNHCQNTTFKCLDTTAGGHPRHPQGVAGMNLHNFDLEQYINTHSHNWDRELNN